MEGVAEHIPCQRVSQASLSAWQSQARIQAQELVYGVGTSY